jgi:hypothetical protein
MKSRIGTFLILIGVVLLFLFTAADVVDAEEQNVWYLVFGVIFAVWGIRLKITSRKPPEDSARFRLVRRLTQRGRKKQDDEDSPEEGEGR